MAKLRALKKAGSSIRGISAFGFGMSWNPPSDQRDVVRALVAYLEDRRALTYDHDREFTPHVTDSIFKIRERITAILESCPENPVLTEPLRAMRAACRKYLDRVGPEGHPYGAGNFVAALGELRGVFGVYLSQLCSAFAVEPENELRAIFPADDPGDGHSVPGS